MRGRLRHFSTATLFVALAGSTSLAVLFGSACSSGPLPHPFVGDAGPCQGQLAKQVSASDCRQSFTSPASACTGSVAYALCNGNTFNVCTCDPPADYFFDGGTVDTGAGAALSGTVPFLDGGGTDLPCCTGKTVFELPASECPAHCTGTSSYAVCVDDAYTECACDIPDGYGFADFVCPGDF